MFAIVRIRPSKAFARRGLEHIFVARFSSGGRADRLHVPSSPGAAANTILPNDFRGRHRVYQRTRHALESVLDLVRGKVIHWGGLTQEILRKAACRRG